MDNNYLNKLKYKLTIIFTLLVFVLSMVLGSIFFVSKYYATITKDKRDFLGITQGIETGRINFDQLVGVMDVGRKLLDKNKMNKRLELSSKLPNFIIIDKNGYIVHQNLSLHIQPGLFHEIFEDITYNKIYKKEGSFLKVIKINDKYGEEYDLISFKKQSYDGTLLISDILRFAIIAGLFSIVFYMIGYAFARKNIEPIEENINDMQNFIHNAGHELKTPISIIRGNLQIIGATKELNKDLLFEGIHEIDRLNNLIDGLVELSDIRDNHQNESISISNEIENICKEFKSISKEKSISISIKKNYNLSTYINKDYFYIFFSNILSNAIKYTQEGGKILIVIDKKYFSVQDNGIGIESYNLEKIFDRFFQADGSRNNSGFGIGLSLVKKISDIYNWKISVNSKKKKGTTFTINI